MLLVTLVSGYASAQCFPDTNGAGGICPAAIPPAACAPPVPPPPFCPVDTLKFTSAIDLSWAAPAGCLAPFDLARGDLDCLVASQNPLPATCVVAFTSAGPSCLLGVGAAVDTAIPA